MGKLAVIKTKENDSSVEGFISRITDDQKRQDCLTLVELMQTATQEKPKMWGTTIIGFGNVVVKSAATGREVEWLKMGFSPRKANLSLYLTGNIHAHADILSKLGKHKTGVGCLYINKLADVDMNVLKELIQLTRKA